MFATILVQLSRAGLCTVSSISLLVLPPPRVREHPVGVYRAHRNLPSICSPSTRISVCGFVIACPRLITAPILKQRGQRVRWTHSYFWGAKLAPCVEAHLRQISCASSKVLQLPSVVFPYARVCLLNENNIYSRISMIIQKKMQ